MLKFANRVSTDEVRRFIKNCGFDVRDLALKTAEDGSYVHGAFKVLSYNFNFIFDDFDFQLLGIEYDGNLIKRFEKSDADITSWDWMCFLRSMFGKEYVTISKAFRKTSEFLTGDFISELSMEDIFTIISKDEVVLGSVKEVEAFDSGTRRFKFFSQNAIREVTLAAYYPSCSIDRCIDEVSFVKYMCQKFGNSFCEYYSKCLDLDFNTNIGKKNEDLPEYSEARERFVMIREVLSNF